MMDWIREGEALPPALPGEPDSSRATRPTVLEEETGVLRMWYAGHDGSTSRILGAVQRVGEAWERLGVIIDAGFSGDADHYGVESPCVVCTPGGYLMSYGGFDGEVTRLHMATSADGLNWVPQGTIMQRETEDVLAATDPCLLVSGSEVWLYYTGHAEGANGPRATIMAAVSPSGASWDRIGPVLEPAPGEVAVSHPCVLDVSATFYMFFGSDVGSRSTIEMATSRDGATWERRGTTLSPSGAGPDAHSVHGPCAVRLHDGTLRMWYAGLAAEDQGLSYRICSAKFPTGWPI